MLGEAPIAGVADGDALEHLPPHDPGHSGADCWVAGGTRLDTVRSRSGGAGPRDAPRLPDPARDGRQCRGIPDHAQHEHDHGILGCVQLTCEHILPGCTTSLTGTAARTFGSGPGAPGITSWTHATFSRPGVTHTLSPAGQPWLGKHVGTGHPPGTTDTSCLHRPSFGGCGMSLAADMCTACRAPSRHKKVTSPDGLGGRPTRTSNRLCKVEDGVLCAPPALPHGRGQ